MKFLLIFLLFSQVCSAQKKSGSGTLTGSVSIGPMCPVEPCPSTPERLKQFYSGFRIVVSDAKGKEVKKIPVDATGKFTAKLNPGTYYVEIKPVEGQSVNPVKSEKVNIKKGQISKVKLEYDTGIR